MFRGPWSRHSAHVAVLEVDGQARAISFSRKQGVQQSSLRCIEAGRGAGCVMGQGSRQVGEVP